MILFLVTVVILVCDAITPESLVNEQWQIYKLEYGKKYKGETEDQYRQGIFLNNLHEINEHNQLYDMGLSSYWLGTNQFSDLLHTEFISMYGMNQPKYDFGNDTLVHKPINTHLLEEEFDWRKIGAVTPVENQGNCLSSWTFGATGALEAQWFRKTGKLVGLSKQNIIDCQRSSYTSRGCHGGFATAALFYIIVNKGIDTESSYPYEGRQRKCRYNPKHIGATLKAFGRAEEANELSLKSVVRIIGPAAALINIGPSDFKKYTGGIYDNPSCDEDPTGGQTVLVVGYGSENGRDFWLVKNSWGTNWGEKGYIRIARNRNNICGIATDAVYPIV